MNVQYRHYDMKSAVRIKVNHKLSKYCERDQLCLFRDSCQRCSYINTCVRIRGAHIAELLTVQACGTYSYHCISSERLITSLFFLIIIMFHLVVWLLNEMQINCDPLAGGKRHHVFRSQSSNSQSLYNWHSAPFQFPFLL